jgi:hypothetical protein
MPRIHLRVYVDPGEAEVVCNILVQDGEYERLTAIIDTGAEVSVFPERLLNTASYRLSERGQFTIEQAGIARQTFEAVEAYVTITLEDQYGNVTQLFTIPVWFANTKTPLIGFAGILDKSVLFIDMLRRIGWLELDI